LAGFPRPEDWMAGCSKYSFRQNKFAVSGDAQVVFLLFVHDDDLAVALKQIVALNARFFSG
jgi:hypothetical protein